MNSEMKIVQEYTNEEERTLYCYKETYLSLEVSLVVTLKLKS